MAVESFFYDSQEREDFEMSYVDEILGSPELEEKPLEEGFKATGEFEGEVRYLEHESGRGLYAEELLDGILLLAEGSLISEEFSGLASAATESYVPE